MSDFQIDLYDETSDETYTLDIDVIDFTGGLDAYTCGLPEDCYPSEPAEVTFEATLDGEDFEIPDHLWEKAEALVLPLAEQQAADAYWDV